jgi:ADP-ribose pyrophosphatase YjhB (NUDIX family)
MQRIVSKGFQAYWRRSRGLTMGAQGLVIDGAGRVLLIRHGYRPGWHFPGGGVERNETARTALSRELLEEAGVIASEPVELFGLYANFRAFPSDHIALFLVRHWTQPSIPKPNTEIAEQGFFAADSMPEGTIEAVHTRLAELRAGPFRAETW